MSVDQAREVAISEGKDMLDLYKMQLELANMYEEAERFDEGIDLLSELIPPLEERVGLYDRLVIVAKMIYKPIYLSTTVLSWIIR